MFNDPVSARLQHNCRLIEAQQKRGPHERVPTDSRQPNGRRRLVSVMASLRRRPHVTTGLLDDAHELFTGHNRRQLERLSRFFEITDLPAGTELGRQGEPAREFVALLSGEVGVTIDGVPHAVLDDGSHFGSVPLLDDAPGAPRPASFIVMTPSRVAIANVAAFHSLMSEFPLVARRVRAMAAVRRTYLAGVAHARHGTPPADLGSTPKRYPAHVAQLLDHICDGAPSAPQSGVPAAAVVADVPEDETGGRSDRSRR